MTLEPGSVPLAIWTRAVASHWLNKEIGVRAYVMKSTNRQNRQPPLVCPLWATGFERLLHTLHRIAIKRKAELHPPCHT
jgi:hypothetical protein